MSRFLAGRFLESLFVLLIVSFCVYMLIGLMPGDPVDLMVAGNPHATADDIARLKEVYGLNEPLFSRYGHWLGSALQGDFGYSRLYSQPVLEILWPRLGASALLLGISMVLAFAIALPLGVAAAQRPHGFYDRLVGLFCFAGISVPPFWLALLLIAFFAVTLNWFPAGGSGELKHLVLPVLTLTLASIAGYTRHARSAVIESLQGDHIRTARAKGCPERRVVWVHALRGAMIPVVTVLALDFGTLFSGALIAETMFAWPGTGKMIFDAIMGNDYNLALIGLLFVTAMILLANFLADILYVALDPRVTLREARS